MIAKTCQKIKMISETGEVLKIFLCTWDTFGQYEWDSAIARTPYWDKTMAKWGKQSCTLSFWVILPKQEYCGKYLMKRLFGPFWETHRICIKVSRVKWKTQNLAGCSFQNSGIIKTLEKPGISRKWLKKTISKELESDAVSMSRWKFMFRECLLWCGALQKQNEANRNNILSYISLCMNIYDMKWWALWLTYKPNPEVRTTKFTKWAKIV